jgi:hypothetical protein
MHWAAISWKRRHEVGLNVIRGSISHDETAFMLDNGAVEHGSGFPRAVWVTRENGITDTSFQGYHAILPHVRIIIKSQHTENIIGKPNEPTKPMNSTHRFRSTSG